MSSDALREAKVWLEQLASADRELVRTSGLAAALLAEVARLEQERDEAKHQRDNFERIARERAERAHANWKRAETAEAALAVAREREPRAVEALREIAEQGTQTGIDGRRESWRHWRDLARAALVDEPAAAATRKCPNCNGFGKVRDSMRVDPVTCGRCDGRGVIPAADEPGETLPLTPRSDFGI